MLAIWQIDRGNTRRAERVAFDRMTQERGAPLQLTDIALTAPPRWQRVVIVGRAQGPAAKLDNSMREHQVGVRILQPVRLPDHTAILVDRGWLPGCCIEQALPALPARVSGRWVPSPRRFTLPGATIGSQGRIDALDRSALARQLGLPLREGVVVLEETLSPLHPWPVRPASDPQRHYAYAVQWAFIGLSLLLMRGFYVRKQHAYLKH